MSPCENSLASPTLLNGSLRNVQLPFLRGNKHSVNSAAISQLLIGINNCKAVIGEAKRRYNELTKKRIQSQKLGTRDFWKIYNSVVNNGQSTIPPLSNHNDVVCTATDKAELLAS